MLPTPVFPNKTQVPTQEQLVEVLGENGYRLWHQIEVYVLQQYPNALCEWNFPGAKYGWSFRIKDKKRAIIYLLPDYRFFKVAFVFGTKATTYILESSVSESIKSELQQARVYAEGRGIRLEVRDDSPVKDIMLLVDVKLAF